MTGLVDVLLPFHRNDIFLKQAVESIMEQQKVSTRLVLIDDRKSNDEVPKIRLRQQDILLKTLGGQGYGRALETGTQAIENPFVAIMNSDDLSLPTRLVSQVESLESSDVSISGMQRISGEGHRTASITGFGLKSIFDARVLLLGPKGADATWCMHSNWWIKNAFFDDKPALDWRIALQAFPTSQVTLLNTVHYLYRRHVDQVTHKSQSQGVFAEISLSWHRLAKSYSLPPVSNETASFFSQPWILPKHPVNMQEVIEWAQAMLKSLSSQTLRSEFERILERRFSLALIGKVGWRQRAQFLHLAKFDTIRLLSDITSLMFVTERGKVESKLSCGRSPKNAPNTYL
jgi:hypothetical protein